MKQHPSAQQARRVKVKTDAEMSAADNFEAMYAVLEGVEVLSGSMVDVQIVKNYAVLKLGTEVVHLEDHLSDFPAVDTEGGVADLTTPFEGLKVIFATFQSIFAVNALMHAILKFGWAFMLQVLICDAGHIEGSYNGTIYTISMYGAGRELLILCVHLDTRNESAEVWKYVWLNFIRYFYFLKDHISGVGAAGRVPVISDGVKGLESVAELKELEWLHFLNCSWHVSTLPRFLKPVQGPIRSLAAAMLDWQYRKHVEALEAMKPGITKDLQLHSSVKPSWTNIGIAQRGLNTYGITYNQVGCILKLHFSITQQIAKATFSVDLITLHDSVHHFKYLKIAVTLTSCAL